MYVEIQSTSLSALRGRDIDVINCCCFSGSTFYLGVLDLGLIMCKVNSDGFGQFLTVLSLPRIQKIRDYCSGSLLLETDCQVFLWNGRKRRLHFLLRKNAYDVTNNKGFGKWIYVVKKRGSEKGSVDVYSDRGRLVSSFETQRHPFTVFINSQHIVVLESDATRVYSNDGYFSLMKTLEGKAMHLDEHYLYCQTKTRRHNRIRLISTTSLEMVMSMDFETRNPLNSLCSVLYLGSNNILVRGRYFLCLCEYKGQNERLEQVWKSKGDRRAIFDGLFVLDTSDGQYLCLDVQRKEVRTILISDRQEDRNGLSDLGQFS